MPRQTWLYIVYGSPLLLFFITLVMLNMGLGLSLVWSFLAATGVALFEFFLLRAVFSRLFPPH